jgi:hypothetical protein
MYDKGDPFMLGNASNLCEANTFSTFSYNKQEFGKFKKRLAF